MKDYQKHLNEFDAHLTLKNFSKATRTAYSGALRQFLIYRLKQGATDKFTQEQARSYILYRHNKNLAWQTINGDYSALFKFYKQVLKLIRSIRLCRTPALGGQKITCKCCGDVRFQYHFPSFVGTSYLATINAHNARE